MIAIDVMMTLCCMVRQIDGNHSEQVWVLGNKLHGSKQTRDIFMNALADMVCIDVVSTSCGVAPKMIRSTMRRLRRGLYLWLP